MIVRENNECINAYFDDNNLYKIVLSIVTFRFRQAKAKLDMANQILTSVHFVHVLLFFTGWKEMQTLPYLEEMYEFKHFIYI